jgi:hypothetical protein
MSSLPVIDFPGIAGLAKSAIIAYGTPALYTPAAGAPRTIKVVGPYRQRGEPLLQDIPSAPSKFLLNPDDFTAWMPEQFETLRISSGPFTGTYAIEAVDWIMAGPELPLLLIQAKGG